VPGAVNLVVSSPRILLERIDSKLLASLRSMPLVFPLIPKAKRQVRKGLILYSQTSI
jgi:hypothetical protein